MNSSPPRNGGLPMIASASGHSGCPPSGVTIASRRSMVSEGSRIGCRLPSTRCAASPLYLPDPHRRASQFSRVASLPPLLGPLPAPVVETEGGDTVHASPTRRHRASPPPGSWTQPDMRRTMRLHTRAIALMIPVQFSPVLGGEPRTYPWPGTSPRCGVPAGSMRRRGRSSPGATTSPSMAATTCIWWTGRPSTS